MKITAQTFKVVVALILMAGVSFWAADSLRAQNYAGTALTFIVGRGPIAITNPSTEPVTAQLVGKGVRTFSVTGSAEGMTGSPVKQGTGNAITNVYTFNLPAGHSEFTVVRGTNSATEVSFVGDTNTRLTATAQPLSPNDARTTLIVAVVLLLGTLYYLSRLYEHRWVSMVRGKVASTPVAEPAAETGGQGTVARGYGDNRG